MVERSLSTRVQPCCMSQLLKRRGTISDFGAGGLLLDPQPGHRMMIRIFSPVTLNSLNRDKGQAFS